MTVTSEIFAILLTCNIAIMGAIAKFLYSLWTDIKEIKKGMVVMAVDQAKHAQELSEKIDFEDCTLHCRECSGTIKTEMRDKDKDMWEAFRTHGHTGLPDGSKVTR